jgi:exodeoxyribonuclease V beta subunit
LTTALFPGRGFDLGWQRLSYSSLAGHRTVATSGSTVEPEDEEREPHEAAAEGAAVVQAPASRRTAELVLAWPPPPVRAPGELPLPLADLPGGTDVGSCVHAILERLDFRTGAERTRSGSGEPLAGRPLSELVREQARRQGLAGGQSDGTRLVDLLTQGLPRVLKTPLGGPLGRTCLADIELADRRDELVFDFPVGGGARARAWQGAPEASLHAALLLEVPPGLDGWTWQRVVAATRVGTMRGLMTGSIDLVFRHRGRYYLADYKTNRISGPHRPGEGRAESLAGHYEEPWLAIEMAQHNYFLQYHIYLVALDRFLRSRLPDYDYDRHVGGAIYLFLRGMLGQAAPAAAGSGRGIYLHRPSAAVISALSACFAELATPPEAAP